MTGPGKARPHVPCPRCGQPMRNDSRTCRRCWADERRGKAWPTSGAGHYSDDAVHSVGRRESIVTFRDELTGRVRTCQCIGQGVPAQLEHGLSQLPAGQWVVESRSTPESILNDLRR